jgi:hypothetical protein
MWGELWDYPFNPAVWGTVAAWVGSLLTGVGVLAAAIYYIYDKRVGDKAQARHVTFVHKHWTSDQRSSQSNARLLDRKLAKTAEMLAQACEALAQGKDPVPIGPVPG